MFGIVFFYFLSLGTNQDDTWSIARQSNGVTVYVRDNNVAHSLGYRCVMEINQSPHAVKQFLENVSSYNTWQSNCERSILLEQEDNMKVYYLLTDIPWPFDDRDMVIKSNLIMRGDTIIFNNRAIDHPYTYSKEAERVLDAAGTWKLIPLSNGGTRIDYKWEGYMGISLPQWLIDHFILEGPYQTMLNLSKKVPLK